MARKSLYLEMFLFPIPARLSVFSRQTFVRKYTQRFPVQSISLSPQLWLIYVCRLDRREGGWVFPANVDVNTLPKVGLAVGKKGEGMGEKMFYIEPRDLAYASATPGYPYLQNYSLPFSSHISSDKAKLTVGSSEGSNPKET